MHIASIGIDLGKTTFHLIALDEHGKIVVQKKFSRNQLLVFTAKLENSLINDVLRTCDAKRSTVTVRFIRTVRIIIVRPENNLHLEAGYIYADCHFEPHSPLALTRRTIH